MGQEIHSGDQGNPTMDNSRALCAQHKHGRNGAGIDAFYLNVTHAYGWESTVYLLL
jgi:hypothetical protein